VDRKSDTFVERERRNSGGMRHFDPEEVGVLDTVQYEGWPQVVFFGPDLNVIELNTIYVPHVNPCEGM